MPTWLEIAAFYGTPLGFALVVFAVPRVRSHSFATLGFGVKLLRS